MHLFCPTCANLLVVEEGPSCYRFACNTCPYVQNIERKVSEEKQFMHVKVFLFVLDSIINAGSIVCLHIHAYLTMHRIYFAV